ncbi:6-bladed beta-propeller [Thermincola ferriacetica]
MRLNALLNKIREKKVNKKDLIIAILILIIAALIFFGWYYFRTKRNPFTVTFTPPDKHKYLFSIYEPGVMSRPLGVAVSEWGDVFVADSANHRVAVFDANGAFKAVLGKQGAGPGEFNYPTGIAVYGRKIYVADFYNRRVQVLNFDGKQLSVLPRGKDLRELGGNIFPVTVAVDRSGNVYVSDVSQHRIVVFDDSGRFVRYFGRAGSNPGELSYVNGIAVNEDAGEIYLANSNNGRIDTFDLNGRYLPDRISGKGAANPKGVAFEETSGNLYVADTLAHKIHVLDKQGNEIETIGQRGLDIGQFNFPTAVAVDNRGRIYVADRGNNRIQVFGR